MHGKVIVITGATSGIGQVAAERLAGMGARMVLVARDRARGEAALARLRERAPGRGHKIHYADFSRLAETKRVAAAIAAAEPHVDVLINNAGALFSSRHVTEAGLELTFFNDLKRDANDFRGIVGAAQFTNLSAYLGYAITTQVGLKIDRRNPKQGEDLTITQSFISVYAGLK